ncbi:MAG: alpha/beta hydrolase [Chloroflexota bacterium]
MIICIHSSGSSGRQWDSLKEMLVGEETVLTPDLLGSGEQKLPDAEITIDDEINCITRQIPERGRFHLVGHSYGGYVAMELARRMPERVLSLAMYEPVFFKYLVYFDQIAYVEISRMRSAVARLMNSGQAHQAAALFVNYWNGDGAWETLSDTKQAKLAEWMPKLLCEFRFGFGNGLEPAELNGLNMPTLILSGSGSTRAGGASARFVDSLLPNSTYQRLAGLPHMGPVTHPAIVNRKIVDFVAEVNFYSPDPATEKVLRGTSGVPAKMVMGRPVRKNYVCF